MQFCVGFDIVCVAVLILFYLSLSFNFNQFILCSFESF